MYGGRGILLSGVPGVPSAEVVILGAGTVGTSAAKSFASIGAQVTVMDINFSKIQKLDNQVHYRINTMIATNYNIERSVRFADVLIGAILIPGARTPQIVTRDIVKTMKPKSLIIDVSIDQGGCIDTSRPTTLGDPTFIEEDIIHYCVPNITGMVARTSTHVITNITTPYILNIANKGIEKAIDDDKSLSRGVNLRNGDIVNPNISR
jgi:alanine dehydrogenase